MFLDRSFQQSPKSSYPSICLVTHSTLQSIFSTLSFHHSFPQKARFSSFLNIFLCLLLLIHVFILKDFTLFSTSFIYAFFCSFTLLSICFFTPFFLLFINSFILVLSHLLVCSFLFTFDIFIIGLILPYCFSLLCLFLPISLFL